ncbi:MAG TPA: GNAT family N-acetyltransferase [Hymenobacter sp.]
MAEQPITSSKVCTLACEVDGVRRVDLVAMQYPLMLVGSARITDVDTDAPLLGDVYVHPDLRRLGIGTLLVRAAKAWADQHGKGLCLHVRPDNPALQLYLDEGFEDWYGQKTDEGSLWLIKCAFEGKLLREGVNDD